MDLYLLAELKTISLKVTTVDMQKPPPDFRLVTSKFFLAEVVSFSSHISLHTIEVMGWQNTFI